jgi:hypothetical protein
MAKWQTFLAKHISFPGCQQVGFLQQGVQPAIRQILG